MLSDLDIAQKAEIKDIQEIASDAGIEEKYLELYGNYKAKVSLEILKEIQGNPAGKYIDVTAITPTPLGEGKTVTTIGLSQSIKNSGKRFLHASDNPLLVLFLE